MEVSKSLYPNTNLIKYFDILIPLFISYPILHDKKLIYLDFLFTHKPRQNMKPTKNLVLLTIKIEQ